MFNVTKMHEVVEFTGLALSVAGYIRQLFFIPLLVEILFIWIMY